MRDEVFSAIKNVLESRFEGVEIPNQEALIPVIEKLVEDYIDTYESEESLKLELAKKDALIRALSNGVEFEVAKEQIEKASTPQEVEAIVDELIKQRKSSKESSDELEKTTEKAGKGMSVTDVGIIGKGNSKDHFEKLLSEI